jgi:hypothetical protein
MHHVVRRDATNDVRGRESSMLAFSAMMVVEKYQTSAEMGKVLELAEVTPAICKPPRIRPRAPPLRPS